MHRSDAIREARGLRSQEEFAAALGVSRQTVWSWEQGTRPTWEHARRLVEAGVDPSVFLPTNRPQSDTATA